LSTLDLDGVITGENFINLNETKIILKNNEGTYDITSIAKPKKISLTEIEFIAPSIDKLNIKYEVRFPLELQLGLSFNNGFDYQFTSFIYENSCLIKII
jgi:hypothetical protein